MAILKKEIMANRDGRQLCLFVDGLKSFSEEIMEAIKHTQAVVKIIAGKEAMKYKNWFSQAITVEKLEELQEKKDELKNCIGLNCGINYIIGKEILHIMPVLNIHPSALPFNRGSHQAFWGIMNSTEHGATLHWMEEGLDSGAIIAQKIYKDDGISTAGEIQEKSLGLCIELVKENIERILFSETLDGGKAQPKGGDMHYKKEIRNASTIEKDQKITGEQVLKLARATCAKGHGFYITDKGQLKARIVIQKIDIEWR